MVYSEVNVMNIADVIQAHAKYTAKYTFYANILRAASLYAYKYAIYAISTMNNPAENLILIKSYKKNHKCIFTHEEIDAIISGGALSSMDRATAF